MSTATLERPAETKTPANAQQKPIQVFKLLYGGHSAPIENWERPRHPETGKPLFYDPETGHPIIHPSHMFSAREDGNNIIRTTEDLAAKYGSDKFQRITGDPSLVDDRASAANLELVKDLERVSAEKDAKDARIRELEAIVAEQGKTSTAPGLEGMTVAQLDELAEAEEIDFSGCRTKADKIAAIQLARAN